MTAPKLEITNEMIEQINSLLNRNGLCPENTICSNCFYKKITGSVIGCNPETAIVIARSIIGGKL
jgi:hypothetical protein